MKNLSCGDGGMITTDEADQADRARRLRWMGIDRSTHDRQGSTYSWEYDCPEIGIKGHMNDITAAIGLVQLGKMPGMQRNRASLAASYDSHLYVLPASVSLPCGERNSYQGWHLYVIRTDRRDELHEFLKQRGIATGVHYKPLHLMGCYRDEHHPIHLPVAEREWQRILSLPMYPEMTAIDQLKVIEAIREFFDR